MSIRSWLAALVLLLGALAGFGNVFIGAWWWQVALVMLGVHVVHLVVRRRSALVSALAGVAALALLVIWLFLFPTTFYGLPTVQTLSGLRSHLSLALAVVAEEQAPLSPPAALTMVLAVGFGLLVVVVNVALRSPLAVAATGVIGATSLAVSSLVIGVNPPVLAVVAVSAGWLLIVVSRSVAPAAVRVLLVGAMTVTAVIAAVLTPPVLASGLEPSLSSWGRPPADVFGRGINPMLRLGENLRRGESAEVLRSITTADDAPYLKVATLVDVDGRTWRPVGDDTELPPEPHGIETGPSIEVDQEEVSIAVDGLDSTMLPMPYPADDVRGLVGSWTWHLVGGTVRSHDATTRGQTYVASYSVPRLTAQELRQRSTNLTRASRYRELPADTPEEIGRIAREQTAGALNDYDRIVALQDWMRGSFDYSESAPVAEGYDGNGVDVIAGFLAEEQSGYCVHFSSALAVMARSLGIPARIAVGYAPGTPAGRTTEGEQVYSTSSDSLHAWTEVWFDGVGWVAFDATPGVGTATSFPDPEADAAGPTPSAPTDDAGASPTPQDQPTQEAEQQEAAAGDRDDGRWIAPAVGATVLAVLLLPGILRVLRRSWRWRRGRAEPLWREITDTAVDLGIELPQNATARAEAEQLRAPTGEGVATVLDLVERERYAAASQAPDEGALRQARATVTAMDRSAGVWRRIRARLWPRSLWTRR